MAICREHMPFEPGSEAFETLNPGLLKPTKKTKGPAPKLNDNGVRIYSSFQGGYRALTDNLILKCSGKTGARGEDHHRLTPDSTLADLCKTFFFISVRNVTEFLQDALNDSAINARTPIGFFLQDNQ